MKKLHIGEGFTLPPETVTSTIVGYGGKGMGKTNFGAVLVEELTDAGLRWSFLDPLGVAWGLRYSADGRGPGIQCVILGGAHGDLPIEPTAGAVVADFVVDEPVNVIIDFSRKASGEMWSIGEKTRFVTDYAKRLFQRQGDLVDGQRRDPIFQVLDEAARYIPQLIPHGNPDLARCVSAWETLVEEGRNVGIGVCLLTQRSARLNKSVSEPADAMISFRIVGPNSIGAVMDWLGEHVPKDQIRKHIETLRALERGRCLVVSPGWLQLEKVVTVRLRRTFDSSATPKAGERQRKVSGKGAQPDLSKYEARMKATIEQAKANDPKTLRAKIAELEAAAKKVKATVVAPTSAVDHAELRDLKTKVAALDGEIRKRDQERKVLDKELRAALELMAKASGKIAMRGAGVITKIEGAQRNTAIAHTSLPPVSDRREKPRVNGTGLAQIHDVAHSVVRKHAAGEGGDERRLSGGARKLLGALFTYPQGLTRSQAKIFCGFAERTLTNYVSELNGLGVLRKEGNKLVLADREQFAYLKLERDEIPPGNTDEVLDLWKPKLSGGAVKLLDYLIETHPDLAHRDGAKSHCGFAERTLTNYVSELASAGLLVRAGQGLIAANKEALFL